METEKFYQKIPAANKILKILYEAQTIFNFTFYFTELRNFEKVALFRPMPSELGLK
jgi:hypothetical protein